MVHRSTKRPKAKKKTKAKRKTKARTKTKARSRKVKAKAKSKVKAKAKKVKAITKAKTIGKVVHFYDKIGVAIVKLKAPVKVGDTLKFQRGEQVFVQDLSSMQIDHANVAKAKQGDVVGIKVDFPIKEGAVALAA